MIVDKFNILTYKSQAIRTTEIDGVLHFALRDVCKALGLSCVGNKALRIKVAFKIDELPAVIYRHENGRAMLDMVSYSQVAWLADHTHTAEVCPFSEWLNQQQPSAEKQVVDNDLSTVAPKLYMPSELAVIYNSTPQRINKLLCGAGFQTRNAEHSIPSFVVTKEGLKAGGDYIRRGKIATYALAWPKDILAKAKAAK